MSSTATATPAPKPIREGLFQHEPPRLLGSTCKDCGTTVFPTKDFCPSCACEGPHEIKPLSATGKVFSYTVVHQAPPGRPTPYVLAYVDLPEQVRVLAQVDHAPDRMSVGMPVRLVLREAAVREGIALIGYAFVSTDVQEAQ